jgi:hypothetical protein
MANNSEKAALMVSQLINLYESGNMPEYFEFRSLMIQTLESGLDSYEINEEVDQAVESYQKHLEYSEYFVSGEIDNLCVEIED